jgi:uncharacterized protein YkwD
MAETRSLEHQGIGDGTPTSRIDAQSYTTWNHIGENIFMNNYNATTSAAFNMYWTSPPHKANVLNENFWRVGFAVAHDSDGGYSYWTTNFSADKFDDGQAYTDLVSKKKHKNSRRYLVRAWSK